jgi:hypothetical protein
MRSETVGSRLFRIQHSSGCRIVPKRLRRPRIGARRRGRGKGDAADHVREAGEVLRRGVDHEVRAVLERVLEHRPEERVVDHDQRSIGTARRALGGVPEIGHGERRVGRRLDQHDAHIRRVADRALQCGRIAGPHRDAGHAPRLEHPLDELLRPPVYRHRVNDGAPGLEMREQGSHDRRHARVEDERGGGAGLERRDLVFEDLGVRMVEAGVDERHALPRHRPRTARHEVECPLRRFGAGEDVRRAAEHGRARGADGQRRVEPAGQDFRGRMQGDAAIAHARLLDHGR